MKKNYLTIRGAIASALMLTGIAGAYAAYPTAADLAGNYEFKSTFTLNNDTYADIFTGDFDFKIEAAETTEGTSLMAVNFLYTDTRLNLEYDETTGQLSVRVLTIRPISDYLGIAPVQGGWQGMSALTGNLLKWQVSESGEISIPDFDLVTFSGTTATGTVASYSDITVTKGADDEPETPGEEKSFAGTYPMTGTKYVYDDYKNLVEKSAFDFDLVINDNNQFVSMGGYTLDAENISYNRNKGVVKGNTLVLYTSPMNGFIWVYKEESTDATLIGGPLINDWSQDAQVVFTLNDDGTYELSPFTIWFRERKEVENEEGELNYMIVYSLIYKWDDTPYESSPSGVETVAADAEAPVRYYNLQGVEVVNPANGIYIKVQGSKAKKIVF